MTQDRRRVSTIKRLSDRTKALADAMEAKAREQLGLMSGQSFEEQFEPEAEADDDEEPAEPRADD